MTQIYWGMKVTNTYPGMTMTPMTVKLAKNEAEIDRILTLTGRALGFDAGWYLLGSWKRCSSIVVAHSSCTSYRFTPFWRGRRTIFGREMAVVAARFSVQTPREAKY